MKPSHAASVWMEDQTLCVELPGTGELSHTIRIGPENSYAEFFNLLRHRDGSTTIAEPGAPTQYQIEKETCKRLAQANAAKAHKVGQKIEVSTEQRVKINEILRDIGIM